MWTSAPTDKEQRQRRGGQQVAPPFACQELTEFAVHPRHESAICNCQPINREPHVSMNK